MPCALCPVCATTITISPSHHLTISPSPPSQGLTGLNNEHAHVHIAGALARTPTLHLIHPTPLHGGPLWSSLTSTPMTCAVCLVRRYDALTTYSPPKKTDRSWSACHSAVQQPLKAVRTAEKWCTDEQSLTAVLCDLIFDDMSHICVICVI